MSDLEQTAMERLRMASEMSLRLYKQPPENCTTRRGFEGNGK